MTFVATPRLQASRDRRETTAWSRTMPLDARGDRRIETWRRHHGARLLVECDVDVRLGKPLDVVRLKGASLDSTRSYASFLMQTAAKLYADGAPREPILHCPCCCVPAADSDEVVTIHGAGYDRCRGCGHVYISLPPSRKALETIFTESEEHAETYTDRAAVETRMQQVIEPKLRWCMEVFTGRRGTPPRSVIDVGAGGGHFVAGCRRAGLEAEGYEISRAARRFALDADFLTDDSRDPADLITMWGLLEYVREPRSFLEAARRRLSVGGGLLVVEVPRFDCISTAIQRLCPDGIARHLDPTSHVNTFSDASIATALVECGFRPVAAWYFGMDAYELMMQLALRLDDPTMLARVADLIPATQQALDQALACDDMIIAAMPAEA
jgi:Methyltransferase domain